MTRVVHILMNEVKLPEHRKLEGHHEVGACEVEVVPAHGVVDRVGHVLADPNGCLCLRSLLADDLHEGESSEHHEEAGSRAVP